MSSLFMSPFAISSDPSMPGSSTLEHTNPLTRHPSLAHSNSQRRVPQHSLTLIQRLELFRRNLMRPFALVHQRGLSTPRDTFEHSQSGKLTRRRSDTVQSRTPMMEKVQQFHSHIRDPSNPTFLSKALKSNNPDDLLSLPFRLDVQRSQGVTLRNMPYLRQSWNRIDFIAVLSFWISFALAMAGVERGTYHIGIFRALSVLRTARLLAITSGTTVSDYLSVFHNPYTLFIIYHKTIMRSLKTARPLLASVAYFVLFAMILFS